MAVGFLLCDDLMFASRITGTGSDLHCTIKPARSAEALYALARSETPCCVIVDLANPGLILADFLEQLRALCSPMPRVVAYGSHVDAATLQAAREAGCAPAWPRSKFVEELAHALPTWMATPEAAPNAGHDRESLGSDGPNASALEA
jgi:DNA-binding NarL/FixJ family response regulator